MIKTYVVSYCNLLEFIRVPYCNFLCNLCVSHFVIFNIFTCDFCGIVFHRYFASNSD